MFYCVLINNAFKLFSKGHIYGLKSTISFASHLELELELEWFIFHRKLMHLHLRKVILSFSSQ